MRDMEPTLDELARLRKLEAERVKIINDILNLQVTCLNLGLKSIAEMIDRILEVDDE